MATTGSNTFVGNQIVTGSIDITGEFLVNGTPISGSGGGSVDTSSLATTGSNTFTGNQIVNGELEVTASGAELKVLSNGTIAIASNGGTTVYGNMTFNDGNLTVNGNAVQNIPAPGSESQTDFVTVSGVEIDGKAYDYTNFGLVNYGASFGTSYAQAFAFESYSDNITFDYGAEVKLNGKGLTAAVFTSGSATGGGVLSLIDNYNGTSAATLQADNVAIGKISGSSTVTGNFVVAAVDTLPAGIPGQIAISGSAMHVYIGGQWNQVAFV
jgi:hypothetical protein